MKKCITSKRLWRYLQWRVHLLVILGWLCLAGVGYQVESSAGWVLPAP